MSRSSVGKCYYHLSVYEFHRGQLSNANTDSPGTHNSVSFSGHKLQLQLGSID